MNAIVKHDAPIAVISDTSAILAIIARAASDPAVDIDKMERLLQMQERVLARGAEAEFSTALAAMQPDLPIIDENGSIKNRDGQVQSTYPLWEDINDAIKPHLSAHGFALSFRVADREGKTIVTGVLSHKSGHRETTDVTLPADTSGSKNAVQAIGSSISYGKRYAAGALLNFTSRGEDDDGKAAGQSNPLVDSLLDKIGLSETLAELKAVKVQIQNACLASNFNTSVVAAYNARVRELSQ